MNRTAIHLLTIVLLATSCGGGDAPSVDATPDTDPAAATTTTPDANPVINEDTAIANGPVDLKYQDGKSRIKGNMRDHKRHGMWSSYFPDGRPQSFSSYVDGVLNGTSVVYHPNGAIHYAGDYRNGKQVGDWRFFDEKGAQVRTVTYDSTGTVINDRR